MGLTVFHNSVCNSVIKKECIFTPDVELLAVSFCQCCLTVHLCLLPLLCVTSSVAAKLQNNKKNLQSIHNDIEDFNPYFMWDYRESILFYFNFFNLCNFTECRN